MRCPTCGGSLWLKDWWLNPDEPDGLRCSCCGATVETPVSYMLDHWGDDIDAGLREEEEGTLQKASEFFGKLPGGIDTRTSSV